MYVDVNLIPNGKAWTVSQHENDGKIACVFNRRGDWSGNLMLNKRWHYYDNLLLMILWCDGELTT